MGVDDSLLPAAAYLTGPFAGDVLRPAIERAGGVLRSHRCTRVYYRPGHDLVAQFRADIDWNDGRTRRETILAATTISGPPPGTLAVTAQTPQDELSVGVWRWPFDPALPALEASVRSTADRLVAAGLVDDGAHVEVDVVAYRPTERAVLRVRATESTWYLKLGRPADAPNILARHVLLRSHGLPVPDVVADDPDQGWMLLTELAGPTLRDLIKRDATTWIEPDSFRGLIDQLASVDGGGLSAKRSRITDAPFHASMLLAVLPEERDRLEPLLRWLSTEVALANERPRGFVHGDLHESQLIVEGGRIVGLLDIDEAGIGDPIDDIAVPVAHLGHRSLSAPNAHRVENFADALVASCSDNHEPRDIAVGTVAVLAGLATAPFRTQSTGWQERISAVLDLIERTLPSS